MLTGNSEPKSQWHRLLLPYISLPPLINYSPIENANQILFREAMVIRAKANIKKNEETTFSYVMGDMGDIL